MATELKVWQQKTRTKRRTQLKARHDALRDMKELVHFDFLRPCESTFDPTASGWRKSRTTYNLITRSVEAMYILSLGGYKSVRVIELRTGHFYYLRTHKNRQV